MVTYNINLYVCKMGELLKIGLTLAYIFHSSQINLEEKCMSKNIRRRRNSNFVPQNRREKCPHKFRAKKSYDSSREIRVIISYDIRHLYIHSK